MWMHLFVLRLCPFVSFSHSLRLAFLHLFRLFPSRLFLFTADIMSPQSATALMESKVPSWGNLVASYVSGSAVIVLSIQTWEGTPPGSLRQSARRGRTRASEPRRIGVKSVTVLCAAECVCDTKCARRQDFARVSISTLTSTSGSSNFALKQSSAGRRLGPSLRLRVCSTPSWTSGIWYRLPRPKVYVYSARDIFYYYHMPVPASRPVLS